MITTSFSGWRALVIHRADHHRDALAAQLDRFGLIVDCVAPAAPPRRLIRSADVVFFDAETGHDTLFPWRRGGTPVPLIAILASEAPGRLEAALGYGATGFMAKPIGSSGAYHALLVANELHRQISEMKASLSSLSERLRARPLVVRAINELMRCHDLDETRAYERLRLGAMASRQSIEELAASIAATPTIAARLNGQSAAFSPVDQNGSRYRRHN